MALGTNLINKVALASTAETAMPTAPDKGSNVASWSSWVPIGSIQTESDSADLDEDSVSVSIERGVALVHPARSLAPEDLVLLRNAIGMVSFTCYDASEALLTLESTISITSNVAQFASTLTFRTLVIEVNGLYFDYFPKVALFIDGSDGGYGDGGEVKTKFVAYPLATSTYAGGWARKWYQAA